MVKINTLPPGRRPRILVAPLDWGLGHATRCIPVINTLLELQAEVWLAGEGAQAALLKKEFPGLPLLHLQGYRVRYGRSARGLLRNMFFQVPRLLRAIRQEHRWLQAAVQEHAFDAVISDNRFGLYHPGIPTVFITHQLTIKSPLGKWAERVLQRSNYRYINRFSECWVPDEPGNGNLAGQLSHPQRMPAIPVYYTGILSRLKKTGSTAQANHLFISLSGPEPQRSILENRVVADIARYSGTAVIARGLPGSSTLIPSTNDIRFYNHLPAEAYNQEIEQAGYVIARSGYSTVMDLAALGKKAILVPTPGQTEQEYLAAYLQQQGFSCYLSQQQFSLQAVLQKARQFHYQESRPASPALPQVIRRFLRQWQADAQPPDLG
ncbi:MAG: glycosyltransferase [Chitinophagaceae bacterium]